ncbi:MAG: hypothetical protein ACRD1R_15935 [Acidobacteriota bacterium]
MIKTVLAQLFRHYVLEMLSAIFGSAPCQRLNIGPSHRRKDSGLNQRSPGVQRQLEFPNDDN